MLRSSLLLAGIGFAVLLTGCDAQIGFARTTAPTAVSLPPGDLDVRFAPADLAPGESIDLVSRTATLRSVALESGDHQVTLDTPDGRVLRVVGLLDGRRQAVSAASGTSGGSTAKAPTSVHKYWVCQGNTCSEVMEYDYDLHAPGGEGTTAWKAPDGGMAEIDRLRFEVELNDQLNAMSLRSDAPLDLVSVVRD